MKRLFISLGLLCIAVLLLFPLLGPIDIFHDPSGMEILWDLRVPRVLTAFTAGAALAASGMIFQALFRNPLATPFTLGVSGGAALGTVLYTQFCTVFFWNGLAGSSLAGFAGAALAVWLVYGLTRLKPAFATTTLLLAGIAVNLFFSSIILMLQYLSDPGETFRMIRWLMGGFSVIGFATPLTLLLMTTIGALIAVRLTREMNLLLTGEEIAGARGVPVETTKKWLFFSASLMTGSAVAFCGPVAFIGLMIPHITRRLVGSDHRRLLPSVLLLGGAFTVICDGIARAAASPSEIPIGLITALLGSPFFLWLLFKKN
jgi:iron complex transport system permease protein